MSARHPHDPMWRLDVGDQRHSGFFADDGSSSRAGKREGDVRAGPRHPQHFPAADGVPGEQGVAERRARDWCLAPPRPSLRLACRPGPRRIGGRRTAWLRRQSRRGRHRGIVAGIDRPPAAPGCPVRAFGSNWPAGRGSTRFSPGERPLILKVASRMATSART